MSLYLIVYHMRLKIYKNSTKEGPIVITVEINKKSTKIPCLLDCGHFFLMEGKKTSAKQSRDGRDKK